VPGMDFLRAEALIPPSVLSTDDGEALVSRGVFSDKDFEGAPLVRVDQSASLQPFHPEPGFSDGPPPGVENFSVRWDRLSHAEESPPTELA